MWSRLVIVAAVAGLLVAAPQTASARGCIKKLPVTHTFKSSYSASYKRGKIKVNVHSTGAWIHHIKAELYTFGGERIAKSKTYRRGFNTFKRLKMKLRYRSMQSGKYNLVLTGYPNERDSCGPKRYVKTVEFHDCPEALPVTFLDLPEGRASDYGRWLSFRLRSEIGTLRDVLIELYDFDGNFFGKAKLGALFGTAKVDLELRHRLVNGMYTLVVDAGRGLPRACGRKKAKQVLSFSDEPQVGEEAQASRAVPS